MPVAQPISLCANGKGLDDLHRRTALDVVAMAEELPEHGVEGRDVWLMRDLLEEALRDLLEEALEHGQGWALAGQRLGASLSQRKKVGPGDGVGMGAEQIAKRPKRIGKGALWRRRAQAIDQHPCHSDR